MLSYDELQKQWKRRYSDVYANSLSDAQAIIDIIINHEKPTTVHMMWDKWDQYHETRRVRLDQRRKLESERRLMKQISSSLTDDIPTRSSREYTVKYSSSSNDQLLNDNLFEDTASTNATTSENDASPRIENTDDSGQLDWVEDDICIDYDDIKTFVEGGSCILSETQILMVDKVSLSFTQTLDVQYIVVHCIVDFYY